MTARLTLTLGSITLLGVLAAPAAAAESIVLMPLELSSGLEASRGDIEGAVVKGLAVANRLVIPSADASARGTYVVSGAVGREGTTFTASFQLLRTADQRTLNTQVNHCDMVDCSVAELARRSARELVRQTLGRASDEPPPTQPVPVQATQPPPDNGAGPARLGIAAVAAGAAAIGVGIYLVAIDGNCSNPRPMRTCKDRNWTMVGGIASIAGGAAAGALGVYLLVRDDSKSGGATVAVGVRPAGLVVAGRF